MSRASLLALALGGGCAAPPSEDGAPFDLSGLEADGYDDSTVLVGRAAGQPVRLHRDRLVARRVLDAIGAVEVEVPAGTDALDLVEALRASGEYAWVEPNLLRRALTVNDPYYHFQWHLDAIDVETAWAGSTGGGAVVAVVDSGVSTGGEDTPNLTAGTDFVDGDSDPSDAVGHGTHVAGTIAQASDNGVGVAGIAYDAQVMPVRVINASGYATVADVADGVIWAADHGADVINLSLGSTSGSSTERAALQYASAAGVFIAAAAGNSGGWRIDYPAAYAEVVAVGATDARDQRTSYSSRGLQLELMAPGGDTSRDDNGDGFGDGVLQETFDTGWGYFFYEGTSMAVAHVSGVAGLLAGLGVPAADIRSTLQSTAVDMEVAGWDPITGYGLVDAGAAVAVWAGSPSDVDGDGWTTADGDCDDADPTVFPGAPDTPYDGIDADCGGDSDCDADADGFDSDAWGGTDCDDADAAVHPGAYDPPYDGIDGDCAGDSDYDADGDGWDKDLWGGADCDDEDPTVYPGAPEVCEDGIDQDCDGADETCAGDTTPPVASGVFTRASGARHLVRFFTDEDATTNVCDNLGNCRATALGTRHYTGWFYSPGTTFTITATDSSGNSAVYGPAGW